MSGGSPGRFAISGSSLDNVKFRSGSATTLFGLMRALKRRGDSITWFEDEPTELVHQRARKLGIEVKDSAALTPGDLADAIGADVLLLQNHAARPVATAKAFRRAGASFLLYDDNTPSGLRRTTRVARYANGVLCHGAGPARLLRRALDDAVPVMEFPPGTDADWFSPRTDDRYASDVVFVGAYDRLRTEAMRRLFFEPSKQLADASFSLFGRGWELDAGRSRYPAVWHGIVPDRELGLAFASAKVCTNVTRRPLIDQDLLTNRIVDVMSTGTVLVTDRLNGLDRYFRDGVHYLAVGDRAEATAVYARLLADDEVRTTIGTAAREEVLAHHTWAARCLVIDQLLARGGS
jgi:spore maturation protein CgeB